MYIERNGYMEKLRNGMWNGQIKVITGLRRCGKSFLLFTIFKGFLLSSGVDEASIICIALDDIENERYRNPHALHELIKQRTGDDGRKYYVLLDEVQYAISEKELRDSGNPPLLYSVLNSLQRRGNVDVYVTGSNSKLLSSDVMTEFRGRGDEIRVFPLSFAEYLPASGKSDREEALKDYMLFGGLPLTIQKRTFEDKAAYLERLFQETYFKDIIERNGIRQPDVLADLTDVLSSTMGSLTNIANLANAINSLRHSKRFDAVSENTIRSYAKFLEDSYLFSQARRYDIRGKEYFKSQSKFYPGDVGLRNACLGFRQIEETRLMEAVLYNDLIRRGCKVDVGSVGRYASNEDGRRSLRQYEIDFVVNKGFRQYYIQSAFTLDSPEKEKRELYPFSIVGDSFQKIVVTRSELAPHYDDHGVLHVGLCDFLLGDYVS